MSDWDWVTFGYVVVYGGVVVYGASLLWRIKVARRKLRARG